MQPPEWPEVAGMGEADQGVCAHELCEMVANGRVQESHGGKCRRESVDWESVDWESEVGVEGGGSGSESGRHEVEEVRARGRDERQCRGRKCSGG